MSGKIISLHGELVAGEASDAIVRILEEELARAKSGEVVALALASIRPNGKAYTVAKCEAEAMSLLGALAFLKQDLMTAWGD